MMAETFITPRWMAHDILWNIGDYTNEPVQQVRIVPRFDIGGWFGEASDPSVKDGLHLTFDIDPSIDFWRMPVEDVQKQVIKQLLVRRFGQPKFAHLRYQP